MTLQHTTAVIMAGGGGTRLWPLSRASRPKQSLPLLGERTLFEMAIGRLVPLIPPERILIVTVDSMAELLHRQAPVLARENFLIEPEPKGTASVIGLAATHIERRTPGAVMACLTADHIIRHEDRFLEVLAAAESLALRGDLVTLGITPTFASTGYGYIHVGEPASYVADLAAHEVLEFNEKPDAKLAETYLASGDYVWNSGMFVWLTKRILEEINLLMPDLASGLKEIEEAGGGEDEQQTVKRVWKSLKSETIDFGVMEQAEGVVVLPADDLGWFDIGGWDRLAEVAATDSNGNLVLAEKTLLSDTSQVVIYQEQGLNRLVATLGLENIVIVDTDDVLLVCDRSKAEQVRNLVRKLSESDLGEYA